MEMGVEGGFFVLVGVGVLILRFVSFSWWLGWVRFDFCSMALMIYDSDD